MDFPFLPSLVFLVAVITPGPANIAISYIAMYSGRVPALIFALGVISGSFTWAMLMMLTIEYISTYFHNYIAYLNILSATYFLWLAYKIYQHSNTIFPTTPHSHSIILGFTAGFLLHITNPKAFIVWSSVFTIAVNAKNSLLATLISCSILAIITFSGYAVLFSSTPLRSYYGKNQTIIRYSIMCFFIGLSIFMLTHII